MTRLRLTVDDLLLVTACVIWGANFVVIKTALDEFAPLAFNGLRFPAAAALLMLLQWRLNGFAEVRPVLGKVVVLGLVGNLAYQLFFIFGLDFTRAGQASLFSSTTPLFTFLFARLSGADRPNRRVAVGVVLAAVGVALLLRESLFGALAEEGFWAGDLLLLGSASSWALYTVGLQPLLVRVRPLALTAVSMAAGAVPLFLLALPDILSIEPGRVSTRAWAGLAYSSLLALVFSYVVWSRAVRFLGSTRTAIYVNLVPVVAVVVAWWWLGETLTPLQMAGATGVVLGIFLARSGRHAARSGPLHEERR